jgi:hypothetical protein
VEVEPFGHVVCDRLEASMKALTWHGKRDVRYEDVPDPRVREHGTGAALFGVLRP